MKIPPSYVLASVVAVFAISVAALCFLIARHEVAAADVAKPCLAIVTAFSVAIGAYVTGKNEPPPWLEYILTKGAATSPPTIHPPPIYSETNSVTVSATSNTAIADVTPLPSVTALSIAPAAPSIPPVPPAGQGGDS